MTYKPPIAIPPSEIARDMIVEDYLENCDNFLVRDFVSWKMDQTGINEDIAQCLSM